MDDGSIKVKKEGDEYESTKVGLRRKAEKGIYKLVKDTNKIKKRSLLITMKWKVVVRKKKKFLEWKG